MKYETTSTQLYDDSRFPVSCLVPWEIPLLLHKLAARMESDAIGNIYDGLWTYYANPKDIMNGLQKAIVDLLFLPDDHPIFVTRLIKSVHQTSESSSYSHWTNEWIVSTNLSPHDAP